ncbi:MAG: histidine--tRNA ligase [Spirochaetaceae bacterium]|jgi:histidyl-tRNA synthetase|nr:histidine--tRNA ligase [Spirochaetaceae bacterium]
METIIEPRVLKGFRDFLPDSEIVRRDLIARIEALFRLYGFVPIDTPALEYAEILLGKSGGETEKQIYRFVDHGNRDVALRFDLTVPFARFLAEHLSELDLPFKRYHIAKVWRGENTQRGRYREFTQCDFDIVGTDSPAADFEILFVIHHVLKTIVSKPLDIRINHRGMFNRFLERLSLTEKVVDILRLVDKRAKIGVELVLDQLIQLVGTSNAKKIIRFIELKGSFKEIVHAMIDLSGGVCAESDTLLQIHRFLTDAGIADSYILDPSIMRGLDYYTGLVYETFLTDLPIIGSICSGGRYDNLASLYSKERIAGVGASIGLDRLIAALEALGSKAPQDGYARLAIACENVESSGAYQALALKFREQGIACEVFFDSTKLTKQYIAAEKKGIRFVLIPSESAETFTIRDLQTRQNKEGLGLNDILKIVAR